MSMVDNVLAAIAKARRAKGRPRITEVVVGPQARERLIAELYELPVPTSPQGAFGIPVRVDYLKPADSITLRYEVDL